LNPKPLPPEAEGITDPSLDAGAGKVDAFPPSPISDAGAFDENDAADAARPDGASDGGADALPDGQVDATADVGKDSR
jgi:hypothetical protein